MKLNLFHRKKKKKQDKILIILSLITIFLLLLLIYTIQFKPVPPSGISQPTQPTILFDPERPTDPSTIKTYTITITKNGFNPKTITGKPYDKIVWVNKDSKDHTLLDAMYTPILIKKSGNFEIEYPRGGTFVFVDKDTNQEFIVTILR